MEIKWKIPRNFDVCARKFDITVIMELDGIRGRILNNCRKLYNNKGRLDQIGDIPGYKLLHSLHI